MSPLYCTLHTFKLWTSSSFKNYQKKGGKKVRGIRKENRKYAIRKIEELEPGIKSTDCRPEGKKKRVSEVCVGIKMRGWSRS